MGAVVGIVDVGGVPNSKHSTRHGRTEFPIGNAGERADGRHDIH